MAYDNPAISKGTLTAGNGSPPLHESGGFIKRLTRHREALDLFLETGKIQGPRGFAEALRKLNAALDKGEPWAIKMVIEFAVGTPAHYHRQAERDQPDDDFNYQKIRRTVREIETTTRSARLRSKPNGRDGC